MTAGIYMIKRKDTGDCYIGQAINIDKRWGEHRRSLAKGKHHNARLQNAWNKYGSDAFDFIVVEVIIHDMPFLKDALTEAEQRWMDSACSKYNLYPYARSPLGFKHSQENREKMKGRVRSPEHCAAISAAKLGVKHTDESKNKMSLSRRKLGIKPPSQKGKPKSAEHRAKIAKALMGNKNTLGVKQSEETKAKKSFARKAFIERSRACLPAH